MSIFCKHKWKIDRHTIPSAASRLTNIKGKVYLDLFKETVITDIICEKCGKHKHYIDTSF